jgi:hypothetical protein
MTNQQHSVSTNPDGLGFAGTFEGIIAGRDAFARALISLSNRQRRGPWSPSMDARLKRAFGLQADLDLDIKCIRLALERAARKGLDLSTEIEKTQQLVVAEAH